MRSSYPLSASSTESVRDNAAYSSTLYLILIQVVSRGLTFVGNQAILRYLSPQHLGLAIQFETLSVSVLYTARESLRVALQRNPSIIRGKDDNEDSNVKVQAAVNVSYLVILLGIVLGIIFGSWYLLKASLEVKQSNGFMIAFWIYAVATLVELCSEPCFLIIQQYGLVRDRARAETVAAIARCVSALSVTIVFSRKGFTPSVLPFAVGQLCYALFLTYVYAVAAMKASKATRVSLFLTSFSQSTIPASQLIWHRFSNTLVSLTSAFYGQSIFKWLLTQGDVLVLSFFADLKAQGIFALASNYGGLVSRLLFQPIEESNRNTFGKLLPEKNISTSSTTKSSMQEQSKSDKPQSLTGQRISAPKQSTATTALNHLSSLVHGYNVLITIPCLTLLPYVFPILITTLLGSKSAWSNSSDTQTLLSAYAAYIPFLAVNGILDAFVTSAATQVELAQQSGIMLAVTIAYLGSAYYQMSILQTGAVGLVYANMLNMSFRIGYSLYYIRDWTNKHCDGDKDVFGKFCKDSLPRPGSIFAAAVTILMLRTRGITTNLLRGFLPKKLNLVNRLITTEVLPGLSMMHAIYLVVGAVIIASGILFFEHEFLLSTLQPLLPTRIRQMVKKYLPGTRGHVDEQKKQG